MRTREIIREARRDGADAGRSAASWAFDGITSTDTYRAVLNGIKDGDPAVLDMYRLPNLLPNLSGEYADEPTPNTLREAYCVESDARWEAIEFDVCDAWETACSDAFWSAVEETCRDMLPKEEDAA